MAADEPMAATYCELERWLVHDFEHLGWMVLANAHGNKLKVKAYKDSVNRLVDAIAAKISSENLPADKKEDLEIMLEKAVVLQDHVSSDFANANGNSVNISNAKPVAAPNSANANGNKNAAAKNKANANANAAVNAAVNAANAANVANVAKNAAVNAANAAVVNAASKGGASKARKTARK